MRQQPPALGERAEDVRRHVARRDHAVEPADAHREPALEPDAHGAHFKVVAVGEYFFHFCRRDRHIKFRLRARMRRIIPAARKAVRLHIA